ncbi:MAG: ACT domain-containing protein [Melioribacteraceae bacterium]|nr:ACT domain-containing protein [Melioribacteraceae bacterium]MCF8414156.1 ACT domain-containing protein [Melioribacteraceae bacterium]
MRLSDEEIRRMTLAAIAELGKDAGPDEIKKVVMNSVSKLDMNQTSSMEGDSGRIILTSFGLNKTGVVAAITKIISEIEGDILDLSQKIMQDFFTMIMIVDISESPAGFKDLHDALTAEANRLGIKIYLQHEDIFRRMHRV